MSTRRIHIHSTSGNRAFGAIQSPEHNCLNSRITMVSSIHKYWNSSPVLKALWPNFSHLSLIPVFQMRKLRFKKCDDLPKTSGQLFAEWRFHPTLHQWVPPPPPQSSHWMHSHMTDAHICAKYSHRHTPQSPPTTARTQESKHCPSLAPSTHLTHIDEHYGRHQWLKWWTRRHGSWSHRVDPGSSRMRQGQGGCEDGPFSVTRAALGQYGVEWEHIGETPDLSSEGSGKASWRMRHPRWDPNGGLELARALVELKREIGWVFYTDRGTCTNPWGQEEHVLLRNYENYSVAEGHAQTGRWYPWKLQRRQFSENDGW